MSLFPPFCNQLVTVFWRARSRPSQAFWSGAGDTATVPGRPEKTKIHQDLAGQSVRPKIRATEASDRRILAQTLFSFFALVWLDVGGRPSSPPLRAPDPTSQLLVRHMPARRGEIWQSDTSYETEYTSARRNESYFRRFYYFCLLPLARQLKGFTSRLQAALANKERIPVF